MNDAAVDNFITAIGFKAVRAVAIGVIAFLLLMMQSHLTASSWKIAAATTFVSFFNIASGAVAGTMLVLTLLIVFPPDAVKAMAALLR